MDFLPFIAYTRVDIIGGVTMNEFEHDVQSKQNDFIDSAVGFVVPFIGFSLIFIVAIIVEFVAR